MLHEIHESIKGINRKYDLRSYGNQALLGTNAAKKGISRQIVVKISHIEFEENHFEGIDANTLNHR